MSRSGKSVASSMAAANAALRGKKVVVMSADGVKTSNELEEELCQHILETIENFKEVIFTLNQPVTVTVKKRNDRFAKVPLIGDEKFRLTNAYVGKRDGVILVMKPLAGSDYRHMEMNTADAARYLDDYTAFETKVVLSYSKEAQADKEERIRQDAIDAASLEERQQAAYGENYGSW